MDSHFDLTPEQSPVLEEKRDLMGCAGAAAMLIAILCIVVLIVGGTVKALTVMFF